MTAVEPGPPFFAAYAGPSMNPTLRAPELLELVPCGAGALRVGDVVLFQPGGDGQPIVHRVVRVTTAGLVTRGDNNDAEDAFLVQPRDVRGRVVAAWRGRSRRTIRGGLPGRWAARCLKLRRVLDRGIAPLLRPAYRTLSGRAVISRLLPAALRPRVVVFHTHGREQRRLLLGRRSIGQFDDCRQQWQVRRPFRLLLPGAVGAELPGTPGNRRGPAAP